MADFDFFKRSNGYLQQDGFFRASADEILYWPKEEEVGFVLSEQQAEDAAAAIRSRTKAWRGKFWSAYTVLAVVIAGFLIFIFSSKGLPDGDHPIVSAALQIIFVLIGVFIPLRILFMLVRRWRVWMLKSELFDDLARSSARRVEQDMPDPILLRPSVTGGHSYPNLIRSLRLLGGFILFFVSSLSFSMLLSTHNPTKLGTTALLLMLMLFGAWRLAVPEMRALSPSPSKRRRKPRNRAEEDAQNLQAHKSDVRNFYRWFRDDMRKGHKGGFVSNILILGVIAIGFTIYLRIDSLNDQPITRMEVATSYCRLIAGRQCTAIPDDLIIERWESTPIAILEYANDANRDAVEEWEDDLLDRLSHYFRLAGFGYVRKRDSVPDNETPFMVISFDSEPVPGAVEGIVAGTTHVENGTILSTRYNFNLPALEALLEEFTRPDASRGEIRDEREFIASFYAIQLLGFDPDWRPEPLTGHIGDDTVNLIPVAYRIHHDPRLIAGQSFRSQQAAFEQILNDIFEDVGAWMN